MLKPSRIAAALVAGLVLAVPPGAGAADWAAVVDAAKAEGRVVLYLTKADAQAEALLAAFREKYGIEGEWLRGAARAQMSKLNGEIAASALQVDVFYSPGPKAQAAAAAATPVWIPDGPSAAGWPAQYVSPLGSVQLSTDPVAIIYNTATVTPPPADYVDLVGKGYVQAIGSPASAFRAAYYKLTRELLGDEYWQKVAADGIVTGASVNALVQGVAAGESDVTLAFPWQAEGLIKAGAALAWVLPESGVWALPQWAMALENGPHPNAGKLLLDFMMSPEGQAILNVDGGISVLASGAIPESVDEEAMTEAEILEVSKWWEATFAQAVPQ
ncbi:MAG: extracellular solute-binding protein [Rhodobacteraceae bacterium]|nr:extracellular solute-binding protein [Paracoccaceae bacterium]